MNEFSVYIIHLKSVFEIIGRKHQGHGSSEHESTSVKLDGPSPQWRPALGRSKWPHRLRLCGCSGKALGCSLATGAAVPPAKPKHKGVKAMKPNESSLILVQKWVFERSRSCLLPLLESGARRRNVMTVIGSQRKMGLGRPIWPVILLVQRCRLGRSKWKK